MKETDSSQQSTERLQKEIAELEQELASLKAALPIHSLSPAMFEQLDDLEYQIKRKKATLQQRKSQPNSKSNE